MAFKGHLQHSGRLRVNEKKQNSVIEAIEVSK
jgi:hypothetical protein